MSAAPLMSADAGSGSDHNNRRVEVALGDRTYPILIGRGLLAQAGHRLKERGVRRVAVVTDENVSAIHGDTLRQSLSLAGIDATMIVMPPGERTKSFPSLQEVCERTIAARLERRDSVVAFGGGVVGDLGGFAAAIVRRGMGFIQIPTTLLAQVDSSVGGKTGINTAAGKNLVGAFYQPDLVLADTAALATLPLREQRGGYAEVVKYGLLGDAAFYDWLEAGAAREVMAGGAALDEAVHRSCLAKAAIVQRDETEQGDRALLNLGHTFGHALEAAVGYDGDRLIHGEAVAIGMRLAFDFSVKLGLCSGQDAVRVRRHLAQVGLPTTLAEVPGGVGTADSLLDAIRQDKKVSAGALTFILARKIGDAFIARDVDPATVHAFLDQELRS